MMEVYTTAKVSPRGKVNAADVRRILENALVFVSPAALLYLLQVYGALQQEGHVFSLVDFVPTNFTLGAIASWFLSTLIDFFRKLRDGKK